MEKLFLQCFIFPLPFFLSLIKIIANEINPIPPTKENGHINFPVINLTIIGITIPTSSEIKIQEG